MKKEEQRKINESVENFIKYYKTEIERHQKEGMEMESKELVKICEKSYNCVMYLYDKVCEAYQR